MPPVKRYIMKAGQPDLRVLQEVDCTVCLMYVWSSNLTVAHCKMLATLPDNWNLSSLDVAVAAVCQASPLS
jgi:hypothetical protein